MFYVRIVTRLAVLFLIGWLVLRWRAEEIGNSWAWASGPRWPLWGAYLPLAIIAFGIFVFFRLRPRWEQELNGARIEWTGRLVGALGYVLAALAWVIVAFQAVNPSDSPEFIELDEAGAGDQVFAVLWLAVSTWVLGNVLDGFLRRRSLRRVLARPLTTPGLRRFEGVARRVSTDSAVALPLGGQQVAGWYAEGTARWTESKTVSVVETRTTETWARWSALANSEGGGAAMPTVTNVRHVTVRSRHKVKNVVPAWDASRFVVVTADGTSARVDARLISFVGTDVTGNLHVDRSTPPGLRQALERDKIKTFRIYAVPFDHVVTVLGMVTLDERGAVQVDEVPGVAEGQRKDGVFAYVQTAATRLHQ